MFDGFEEFTINTGTVDIHGLRSANPSSPELPPLLLLHGFPQTLHIWHRIAPRLTRSYSLVLLDLRGYGASSKPAEVSAYAKSAMARDCAAVMDELGFRGAFFVCAHDRGARVAHKLCVDRPERVRRALLLDICPTLAMFAARDPAFAREYFHWFLLTQPAPLPEALISGAPARRFAELFMGARQEGGLAVFDARCFERYVAALEDPAAVHAMCQDYRASATLDLEEARGDLGRGRLVRCPLMVLWARRGVIEKCFDAIAEWRAVAGEGVPVTGYSVDSGHYIPEQAPDEVVSAILEFLV